MAVLTRDDNRFPLDGTNFFESLATAHLLAGVPKRVVALDLRRRSVLIGNPHASLFVRLAMTSGVGLAEGVWILSIPPQGSVVIDGAYAQAEVWAYCYETIDLPYQVG